MASTDPFLVYPPTPLHKYPHLAGDDIEVWHKFVTDHGHLYQGFVYDLQVGVGIDPGIEGDETLRKMWRGLTKKRIDVLGILPNRIDVIEVKGRPGISVLGQALGYVTLLSDTNYFTKPLQPVVIGGIIEPDIERVLNAQGVKFYDVGDDHSNLVNAEGNFIN